MNEALFVFPLVAFSLGHPSPSISACWQSNSAPAAGSSLLPFDRPPRLRNASLEARKLLLNQPQLLRRRAAGSKQRLLHVQVLKMLRDPGELSEDRCVGRACRASSASWGERGHGALARCAVVASGGRGAS